MISYWKHSSVIRARKYFSYSEQKQLLFKIKHQLPGTLLSISNQMPNISNKKTCLIKTEISLFLVQVSAMNKHFKCFDFKYKIYKRIIFKTTKPENKTSWSKCTALYEKQNYINRHLASGRLDRHRHFSRNDSVRRRRRRRHVALKISCVILLDLFRDWIRFVLKFFDITFYLYNIKEKQNSKLIKVSNVHLINCDRKK